jgi:glutamate synthase (NADPH/NADH) large chain
VANPDGIDWYPVKEMAGEFVEMYKTLLEIHVERTGSARASDLLDNWDRTLNESLMIVPKESAKQILGSVKKRKAS